VVGGLVMAEDSPFITDLLEESSSGNEDAAGRSTPHASRSRDPAAAGPVWAALSFLSFLVHRGLLCRDHCSLSQRQWHRLS